MAAESPFRSGYVALIGRPNAGKSTLLNRLLGQKISITSRKPQTTRHRIHGIKTTDHAQVVFVDTPGIHAAEGRALNQAMNRAAFSALADVDLIVWLVDGLQWTEEDRMILGRLKALTTPAILAINKVDKIKEKERLLPHIDYLRQEVGSEQVVPISARTGTNVDQLESLLVEMLAEGPPMFPEDQVTDRSMRFMAAETVREKLMRQLGQELPYSIAVEIENFEESETLLRIAAVIWVERQGQKRIVIGKQGAVLKEIGRQARLDMEKQFGTKVFLQLWVKVREGWSDDLRALRSLGLDES